MSITKTLSNKDLSAEEKLSAVAEVVSILRKSYGNTDVKIEDVKFNTSHGMLPFSNLEEDSKVEALLNEALNIKSTAITAVEDNPGIVLNKKVEELIATSPLFANASAETAFEVL